MDIEEAHRVIKERILALGVTTYFQDDDQGRAFRYHQALRLLDENEETVREALAVLGEVYP